MNLPARFPLAILPTPLVRARHLEQALQSPPIYIKRDDLAGFGFAGNKARKLELILAEALAKGSDVLVTGGGPGSNHCVSAAAACQVGGLDCVLIIYGDGHSAYHPNLTLARSFGAQVHFTGDSERESVDMAIPAKAAELEARGRRPYPVPRGGATTLGSAAYVMAGRELAGQLEAKGVEAPMVIVPNGSCGTQAGLVSAAASQDDGWRVVGASVSRPIDECRRRVLDLAMGSADLLGLPRPTERHVDVIDARGPGFGLTSPKAEEAAGLAARTEGLLLDPVYTAKAFGVLIDFVASGRSPVTVFLHTGGLPAAIWQRARDSVEEHGLA